jgi:BirA family biotin operon repressor/biotin-[acetyl-CoA-carboxylase] ligase
MEFRNSRGLGARFEYLEQAGSTNDVLVTRATGSDADAWPHLSVIVTDNQTSGRGRLGRSWLAPSGKSLAISVLLRPRLPGGDLPVNRFGWFPLLAGAAMTRAVRQVLDAAAGPTEPGDEVSRHAVTLKWPNDVLIDGYKVSGILSELLPDLTGLCIGAGLNLALDEHDLPTLTSTSLLLVAGSAPDPDAVLAAYLTELGALTADFIAAGADPVASGLHAVVSELCGTIGTLVRVEMPGGHDLVGTAVGLDPDGRLIVEDQATGEASAVAAGDVTHLRH